MNLLKYETHLKYIPSIVTSIRNAAVALYNALGYGQSQPVAIAHGAGFIHTLKGIKDETMYAERHVVGGRCLVPDYPIHS